MSGGAAPAEAGTVLVRVQVIDMEAFTLDLVVPTYLPARDLTQRVARDAGLGAYWEDGHRRNFWLRARGRLMQEEERLEDLGVVPYELLHLLPEPPRGSGVKEQDPDYPLNKGYAVGGMLNVALNVVLMAVWTGAWTVALTFSQKVYMGFVPALALALICVSTVRHMREGHGSAIQIPIIALFVFLPFLAMTILLMVGAGAMDPSEDLLDLVVLSGSGFMGGAIGVTLGWLAWFGAVEPLPEPKAEEAAAEVKEDVVPCAICGLAADATVRLGCKFQCGKHFHVGCYKARQAVFSGPGCAVCGYNPSAAA